jgi:hypothetical protein
MLRGEEAEVVNRPLQQHKLLHCTLNALLRIALFFFFFFFFLLLLCFYGDLFE